MIESMISTLGGVQTEETGEGIEVGPEVLLSEFPATLGGYEVGDDCTSTHGLRRRGGGWGKQINRELGTLQVATRPPKRIAP